LRISGYFLLDPIGLTSKSKASLLRWRSSRMAIRA
jgi:hypothetical protein